MAKRGSLVAAAFSIIKHHFGGASNAAKFKECDCFNRQKMKMKLNKFMYGEQYECLQKTLKNDQLTLDDEKVEKETDGKIKEEEELVVKEKDEAEENEEEKPEEKKKVEEENEKKKKDEFYSSSMESLSKVMIVQGIGDMSLKSLATLISVTDKSPTEASLEIMKSMTGIDAKEQMKDVAKIKSFIEAMDENMEGKLDSLIEKIDVMDERVHNITEKIDAIAKELDDTEKIDGKLDGNLTQKLDAIDRKLDRLSGKLDAIPPATPRHSPSSAVTPPPPTDSENGGLADSENGDLGNSSGYLGE